MGISVFLIGTMLRDTWDSSTVAATHEALTSAGLESAQDRPEELVTCEITADEDGYSKRGQDNVTVAEFTERLYDAKSGDIHYGVESGRLKVTHRSSPEFGDLSMPVGFGGLDAHFFDPDSAGTDAVDRRVETLTDAFAAVATAIDPTVGSLLLWNDHGRSDMFPEVTTPAEHQMGALPWLLLLSEPWIAHCGGRDHVLETPVYDVRPLDTGSMLVRTTKHPDLNGCRYESGFTHLFGG